MPFVRAASISASRPRASASGAKPLSPLTRTTEAASCSTVWLRVTVYLAALKCCHVSSKPHQTMRVAAVALCCRDHSSNGICICCVAAIFGQTLGCECSHLIQRQGYVSHFSPPLRVDGVALKHRAERVFQWIEPRLIVSPLLQPGFVYFLPHLL